MSDELNPDFSGMEDEAPVSHSFAEPEDALASEPSEATMPVEARVETSAVSAAPAGTSDHPVLRSYEKDVHDTSFELRRIETDIRDLLADRDPVRKRKFTGTAKWHELEDDLISWRFTGRFDEELLRRVQEMVSRRHYLFRHLRYLCSTRPVWNS